MDTNRTHTITIRLNDDEFSKLQSAAESYSMSITKYVHHAALSLPSLTSSQYSELINLAGKMNQISKKMNSFEFVDPAVIVDLLPKLLSEVLRISFQSEDNMVDNNNRNRVR